eukprot:s4175_g4.t2
MEADAVQLELIRVCACRSVSKFQSVKTGGCHQSFLLRLHLRLVGKHFRLSRSHQSFLLRLHLRLVPPELPSALAPPPDEETSATVEVPPELPSAPAHAPDGETSAPAEVADDPTCIITDMELFDACLSEIPEENSWNHEQVSNEMMQLCALIQTETGQNHIESLCAQVPPELPSAPAPAPDEETSATVEVPPELPSAPAPAPSGETFSPVEVQQPQRTDDEDQEDMLLSSLLNSVKLEEPFEDTPDVVNMSMKEGMMFGDAASSDEGEADSDQEGLDNMTSELMAPVLS